VKQLLLIIILLLSTLSGCKKKDNPVISGIATIESTLYGTGPYYAYGFSFSIAGKTTTISDPGPDITVYASKNIDGSISQISFEASNYQNSFSLASENSTEADAKLSFKELKTVGDGIQWGPSAIQLKGNQIWLYRTNKGNYAKLRLISVNEETIQNQLCAVCTFEWIYQPDGSVTFPSV
jgi:hypothetical protein